MNVYTFRAQGRHRSKYSSHSSGAASSRRTALGGSVSRFTQAATMVVRSWQTISLRTLAFVLLLALGLQFLLGMLANLYVQVPSAHPGAQAANYFIGVVQGVVWALARGPLWLQLHALLELLVFVGAIGLLIRAIAMRSRAWIILASLGLAGIIGAGFNGASFLNYGLDISSLIMSATFLLAMIAYLIGVYMRG